MPRTDPGLPEQGVPGVREVEEAIEESPEADGDRGDMLADPLFAEITPLPWNPSGDGLRILSDGHGADADMMADKVVVADSDSRVADFLFNQPDRATRKANIRYILRAVNAYEPLAKACEAFAKACREGIDNDGEIYRMALEALEKIREHS